MKHQLFLHTVFAVVLIGSQCIKSSDVQLKLLRCRQSSNYFIYGCNRAIDGNQNQQFLGYSCSHVGSESRGWWSAQVEKTALMKEVRIYNRKDCCAERLTNFTISVDGSVCSTYTGAAFSEKSFSCGKKGFVLRITSFKPYMALCEVVVTGQYADEKLTLTKCQQSSTYGVGLCAKAIDGNLNQDLSGGSCSHVGSESVGWWKAETIKRARFNYVHIFNRQDCCGDRLTKFEISVNERVCHAYNGVVFNDKFLSCFKYGSVLKISSSKPYLTLCEVVVIGRYLDQKLNAIKCVQSSTFDTSTCSRYIDGDTTVNPIEGCSKSELGRGNPDDDDLWKEKPSSSVASLATFASTDWWKITTEKPALFDIIRILYWMDWPLIDSLINFKIFVDDILCRTYNGKVFSDRSFLCFKKGTEFKIVSKKPSKTLCKVIALGEYVDKAIRLSKCKQSSTFKNLLCDQALDGTRFQPFGEITACSKLNSESTGWWQADTDKPAVIDFVKINSRNAKDDYSDSTLTKFKIYMDNVLCREYDGPIFSNRIFPCFKAGTKLKIASSKPYMTVCEVEAFGEYVSEYAD